MRKFFIWSPCQWLRETKQLFGEALDVNLSMDKEKAFENGFHYVVLAGNVCLLAKVKESSQADLMGTVEYRQSGQDWGICSNEPIRRYNMIQIYIYIFIYNYVFCVSMSESSCVPKSDKTLSGEKIISKSKYRSPRLRHRPWSTVVFVCCILLHLLWNM